ncbi:MAG: hypothetical protein JNM82_13760, partial [Rhodocyclaceae bacterium]|nr:hypothetical protein [Rhodocyclaceae bacterium]
SNAVFANLGATNILADAIVVDGVVLNPGAAMNGNRATASGAGTDVLANIDGIRGSAQADVLVGGGGSTNAVGFLVETFIGGAGNDFIAGSAGAATAGTVDTTDFDRADYLGAIAGINANTALGKVSDGQGGIDVLRDINMIRGSGFYDIIVGRDTSGVGEQDFEAFEGMAGDDEIDGGGGFDRAEYRYSPTGVVANLGTGIAQDGWGNADHLTGFEALLGSDFADTLIGGGGNDVLTGMAGNDSLDGGAGTDRADYREEFDADGDGKGVAVNLSAGAVTLSSLGLVGTWNGTAVAAVTVAAGRGLDGWGGTDILAGVEDLRGTRYADVLAGGAGGNVLDGQEGDDTLAGGAGNDTYLIDSLSDVLVENPGEGTDTAQASITGYTLAANVENLVLLGSVLAGTGGATDNTLTGNAVGNTLTGGAGNDTLLGLAGNDTLVGGADNDQLDGGTGDDSLAGGVGNDLYLADSLLDAVTENSGEGTDTVQASITGYSLSANVENLLLLGSVVAGNGGTTDNTVTGNGANNSLTGGAGNDTLLGLGGNDTLVGGADNDQLDGGIGDDSLAGGVGNDLYLADSLLDAVTENSGEGTDTVQVSITGYSLSANVENLLLLGSVAAGNGGSTDNTVTGNGANNSLTGGAGNDTLLGLAGNDTLVGGADNDQLDGGTGNDSLAGGAGNDTYLVDSLTDLISESAAEGTDSVQASVSGYVLTANVENLVLLGAVATGTGSADPNTLTGNGADNTLAGAAGNDTLSGLGGNDSLDGGVGNDSLVGGIGNDVYAVDSLTDAVVESAGEGSDTVQASVDGYTLAAQVENLVLLGTIASGIGNGIANQMTGNASANTLSGLAGDDSLSGGLGNDTLLGGADNDLLDGGGGTDSLSGGTGNDTYVVDALTDVVTESAGEGTDTVQVAITGYTLAAEVENLVLTGTVAAGTGNDLGNLITGNAAANTLNGGSAGNDTLVG